MVLDLINVAYKQSDLIAYKIVVRYCLVFFKKANIIGLARYKIYSFIVIVLLIYYVFFCAVADCAITVLSLIPPFNIY